MEMKKRCISLYVENQIGVLAKISGLFAGKSYNLDTLTVGETEDPTVSRMTIEMTMDAAVAYTLTKAICENKEALVTAVASLEYFDPTIAGGSGYTGCPLHPGAKAYYEEMGYECD